MCIHDTMLCLNKSLVIMYIILRESSGKYAIWTILPKHCSIWYVCMGYKYNAMLTYSTKTDTGPELHIFLVLTSKIRNSIQKFSWEWNYSVHLWCHRAFLLYFCKIEQVKDGKSNLIIILLIFINLLFFYLIKKVPN